MKSKKLMLVLALVLLLPVCLVFTACKNGKDGPAGEAGSGISAGTSFPTVNLVVGDLFIKMPEGTVYTYTGVGEGDARWTVVGGEGALKGPQGAEGNSGTDGVTPHINETTGTWWIGEVDTGVKAGGKDGATPYISDATGTWWIGQLDTEIKAQGPQGSQGIQGPTGSQGETGKPGDSWFIYKDKVVVVTNDGNGNFQTEIIVPTMVTDNCCCNGGALYTFELYGSKYAYNDQALVEWVLNPIIDDCGSDKYESLIVGERVYVFENGNYEWPDSDWWMDWADNDGVFTWFDWCGPYFYLAHNGEFVGVFDIKKLDYFDISKDLRYMEYQGYAFIVDLERCCCDGGQYEVYAAKIHEAETGLKFFVRGDRYGSYWEAIIIEDGYFAKSDINDDLWDTCGWPYYFYFFTYGYDTVAYCFNDSYKSQYYVGAFEIVTDIGNPVWSFFMYTMNGSNLRFIFKDGEYNSFTGAYSYWTCDGELFVYYISGNYFYLFHNNHHIGTYNINSGDDFIEIGEIDGLDRAYVKYQDYAIVFYYSGGKYILDQISEIVTFGDTTFFRFADDSHVAIFEENDLVVCKVGRGEEAHYDKFGYYVRDLDCWLFVYEGELYFFDDIDAKGNWIPYNFIGKFTPEPVITGIEAVECDGSEDCDHESCSYYEGSTISIFYYKDWAFAFGEIADYIWYMGYDSGATIMDVHVYRIYEIDSSDLDCVIAIVDGQYVMLEFDYNSYGEFYYFTIEAIPGYVAIIDWYSGRVFANPIYSADDFGWYYEGCWFFMYNGVAYLFDSEIPTSGSSDGHDIGFDSDFPFTWYIDGDDFYLFVDNAFVGKYDIATLPVMYDELWVDCCDDSCSGDHDGDCGYYTYVEVTYVAVFGVDVEFSYNVIVKVDLYLVFVDGEFWCFDKAYLIGYTLDGIRFMVHPTDESIVVVVEEDENGDLTFTQCDMYGAHDDKYGNDRVFFVHDGKAYILVEDGEQTVLVRDMIVIVEGDEDDGIDEVSIFVLDGYAYVFWNGEYDGTDLIMNNKVRIYGTVYVLANGVWSEAA